MIVKHPKSLRNVVKYPKKREITITIVTYPKLEAGRSAQPEDQPGLPNEMEHQFGVLLCSTSIVKKLNQTTQMLDATRTITEWTTMPLARQIRLVLGQIQSWYANTFFIFAGWLGFPSHCRHPSPIAHRSSRSMTGKETSWMPMLEAGRSAQLANDNKTLIRSSTEYRAWSWFRKRSERRPRGDKLGYQITILVSSCATRKWDGERKEIEQRNIIGMITIFDRFIGESWHRLSMRRARTP